VLFTIAVETNFSRLMAIRLALLLSAIALFTYGRNRTGLGIVIAALALQPLLGHGATMSMHGAWTGALHVIAAALWLGSLLQLYQLLGRDHQIGILAAQRFSPIGLLLLLALGAGIVGQWRLTGGVAGIFGTYYGRLLLVKSALFAAMLACALLNGAWLAPAGRRRVLRYSIAAEAAAGLLVVLVASQMAMQVPGLHDRPVWPFPVQPVANLWQDAFLRDRLLRMFLPFTMACTLLTAALLAAGRARWISLTTVLLAALILMRMPVFPMAPFLQPAVATTFQKAPFRRTAASLLQGKALFLDHCAGCHGADARGAGPQATGDPIWPPDLTASYFTRRRDGDWLHAIRHGLLSEDGRVSMSASPELTEREIWQIIDYLRGLAAAASLSPDGLWHAPAAMPALQFRCKNGTRVGFSRFETAIWTGRTVLDPASNPAISHIDLEKCAPLDPMNIEALEILIGGPLSGRGLFIDAEGFLRAIVATNTTAAELSALAEYSRNNPISFDFAHH
jgi:mono/diheme cytochrome c family protein